MASTIAPPDAHVSLTLDELAGIQSSARMHLTFSLTLACPLRCDHCIVDAGPELGHTTMPLAAAQRYAAQMPDLYAHGIRMISFTGGEPLLAREQLRVMSTAAADAGMVCGVVTAAHWATSDAAADRVVARYPGIRTWDISVDTYHEDFQTMERPRTAYLAVRRAGRRPVLRFAHHEPLTPREQQLLAFMAGFADERDICSQRIRSVGRATDLPVAPDRADTALAKPCITKGLVIRYDGSTAPCCVNLVEERRHPFQLGDATVRPLAEVHGDYLSQPLLQLIRVLGFGDVVRWLREAGLEAALPPAMPEDVCDLCPHVVTKPEVASYLTARASEPATRLRIALLASQILGEHEMLRRTVAELAPRAREIDGFDVAATIAAAAPADAIDATALSEGELL